MPSDPMAERCALVTGASSGIGRVVVERLLDAGWKVAAAARRLDRLQEIGKTAVGAPGELLAIAMDVTQPDQVADGFAACLERWGRSPGLVVSNAGVSSPGLLADLAPALIHGDILTNLAGPAVVAHHALKAWEERTCPTLDLVFVTSDAAPHPRPFQAAYSAAKMGTEHLARVLAMEYDDPSVRISVVRPGATISDFAASWVSVDFERVIALWRKWGLQQHLDALDPSVVADAIVWVATQPPGAHVPILEVQPRPPVRAGRAVGAETDGPHPDITSNQRVTRKAVDPRRAR
ncbi:MAG: SDR family NAD(P)-dependent oxidoreductase [Acidimicrobiia bacterium]|nr:SDR family NAD(P)-dependent oxidoreductase [Acidimicrobiia bacterium]MBP8179805.1 SDR family NAD(P)-dependent oxidoreductase [Acidimicrobiia bacterium]